MFVSSCASRGSNSKRSIADVENSMSLADLWSISREQLEGKQVRQIIAFAGGGQLTDSGAGASEFREFLGLVPSDYLSRYAEECLGESFSGSGFALQDVEGALATL
jgi:hypothetical protein